ncbi:MAG: 2-dehydropantoate 2-reductase, partial [Candidatus Eremiobacteraeota bacterium]|nr:2-dehydropantoate 2-reductase [Candidatus Eremiobacteraeota bacterium]
LAVKSAMGDFTVNVPAASDLRELPEVDAVLVVVKAHQFLDVLPQLTIALERGATVVPMQNGIPFWYFEDRALESVDPGGTIRRTIPREQIVGTVIHTSGEILGPGLIHQSGEPTYLFGVPSGVQSQRRLQEITALFNTAAMDATALPDLRPAVWRKLLGNVSLNPVSALTGRTIKPMLEDPASHRLIARLMAEALDVARAAGVELEISIEERIAMAARLADVKTSMLQDLEAGRELELEPIVGAVIEVADALRVRVAVMRTVYALTKSLRHSNAA